MKTRKLAPKATVFFVLLFCMFTSGVITANAQSYPEQPTSGPGIDSNAMLLFDFETPAQRTGWGAASSADAVKVPTFEFADAEKGDPVRFGRYALKINWDFSGTGSGTLAQHIEPPFPSYVIPASYATSGFRYGMWIYCSPECSGNIWFRLQQSSPPGGNSTTQRIQVFGNEPSTSDGLWLQPGTWKYHEFSMTPDGSGLNKQMGPFLQAFRGIGTFRFLHLTGSVKNPNTKGYVILDNIRVINSGTSIEDRIPPIISALTGNGVALMPTETTFNVAQVDFSMTYRDAAANSSGINPASAKFIVNGVTYGAGDAGFMADETTATLTSLILPGGANTVVAHVEDMFGFITTKSSTFTVEGGTAVALAPAAEAHVGNAFEMAINTNNMQDVKALSVTMNLNSLGSVAAVNGVEFASSASASSYFFSAGTLTINLVNDVTIAEEGAGTLATIKVSVSKVCTSDDVLRITPVSANVTYADETSANVSLFSGEIARSIKRTYDVTVLKRVVGAAGEVLVTDLSGNPVSGATVYAIRTNGSAIANGTTNESGVASFNFTTAAQAIMIYAENEGKYSYTEDTSVLSPVLGNMPSGIRSGTTTDPSTMKTFTWYSNPATSTGTAFVKIAKKSDGEGAFVTREGESRMLAFDGSNDAAQGNKVTITGLLPETEYIYQVGDGTNWSATREFKTTSNVKKFSFSAFGDVQASTNGEMNRFLAAAQTVQEKTPTPFFSLNVGDVADRDYVWHYHTPSVYLFDQRTGFANIDLVAGYGNHEYDGYGGDYLKGIVGNNLFINGHPKPEPTANANMNIVGDGTYYALYGSNMIVIGLDFEGKSSFVPGAPSTSQIMTEQANWMDDVLEAHKDRTWKIITIHYPIYPTPTTYTSQTIYGKIFEKHGVQVVFCGHGHTFECVQVKNGTSSPIINRNASVKVKNPVKDGGALHWQLGDMVVTGGNGKWVFAEVDEDNIVFTTFDSNNQPIPELTMVLETTPPNSIEKKTVPSLKVFPNPFAEVVCISDAEGGTLQVMNITGVTVHSQEINSANEFIALEQLPAGVYLFNVKKDGQKTIKKVVKK